MPSLRILTCVKLAETRGKIGSFAVSIHPQLASTPAVKPAQDVQNHLFLPVFHLLPTHDYPQSKTATLHLLSGMFSPPSTGPITITRT